MKLADQLYVAEGIEDLGTIIYCFNRNMPVFNIYCIVTEPLSENTAQIIRSGELFTEKYKNRDFTIVGIGAGKRQTFDLLRHIIQEIYNSGKTISDFKQWVLQESV